MSHGLRRVSLYHNVGSVSTSHGSAWVSMSHKDRVSMCRGLGCIPMSHSLECFHVSCFRMASLASWFTMVFHVSVF